MKLYVHELRTQLAQVIQVGHQNLMVGAIRPHLVVYGRTVLEDMGLQVKILGLNGKPYAVSNTLTVGELCSLEYAHGYYRFDIDANLRAGQTYRVALFGVGSYSYDAAAFVGWVNEWGFRDTAGYTPKSGWNAPFDFELWSWKQLKTGVA